MCGICGVFGYAPPGIVEAMVGAMRHRGPDDRGTFQEEGVSLGMARLAIIDLTPRARQPMRNEDGSVWIVYNGEAYNFRQERAVLEAEGQVFRSDSDTEVVLRMYERYGDDFLLRIRGMFSLAVYDRRKGQGRTRLLLARDPLGIKPLLYAREEGRFLFASEVKAILASGLVGRRFDPESLRLLLTFGSIPQPRTAVAGVRMLPPGHRMIVDGQGERLEPYWRLGTNRRPDAREMSYPDLVSEVRSALEESVRLHMVSDVPVGAFLSGGVDSALLVALMAKESPHKVRTFSVGFGEEGSQIDETDDAARIARMVGTEHTRVAVTGQDVRDRLAHIATALDQPSVDGVNSYFVSLAASRGVKVAVSGTGGDELFGGYPWFITMVRDFGMGTGNSGIGKPAGFPGGLWRTSFLDPLALGRFGDYVERMRAGSGFVSRYARIYRIFGVRETAGILSREIRILSDVGREPARDIAQADELPHASPIDRVTALCLRGYTQNQLLRDIDSVSMGHSLEVRVPFLDPVVTDLALSLPPDSKVGNVSGLSSPEAATYRESGAKRILIDSGKGLLPEGLDLQKKRGFGMPFGAWMNGPLREVLENTLSGTTVRRRGFFREREVERLKRDFLEGKTGWPKPWLLMMTELWCREVLDH